jgi:exonuclease SbcD
MLPFIKPIQVKRYSEEESDKIISYNDAYKVVMNEVKIDTSQRNIILAHQFVTGAKTCDSEELAIGGMDNISVDNFEGFDYVALGHIHSPQKIVKETIRYSGTPLKYSLSEMNHNKCVTLVEIKDKKGILDILKNSNDDLVGVKVKNITSEELKEENGAIVEEKDKNDRVEYINIEQIPLTPLHDMRHVKGTYAEITLRDNYKDTDTDDYMYITLTDEDDIPDAIGRLRSIYPNIMKLEYDNLRTRKNNGIDISEKIEEKTPMDLFKELYEMQNNQEMSEEQVEYMQEIMETSSF